jgi:hypothetical protein
MSLAFVAGGTAVWPASSAEPAGFNHRQFLKDVTGSETAYQRFTTLSTQKKALLDAYGLTDTEYRTFSVRTIRAMAVPAALEADGWSFVFDWSGDLEDFFTELGQLLKKRGVNIDIKTLQSQAMEYLARFTPGRGDHIGYVYGPVAEALEAESLLLANLNDTGDAYRFFLLPRAMMSKWLGKKLDSALEIEHPGAYFPRQLNDTRYAKYFAEAPRPGKKSPP